MQLQEVLSLDFYGKQFTILNSEGKGPHLQSVTLAWFVIISDLEVLMMQQQMHVPQSSQENVCNKWIFGVVMEGGQGVALVIILCRLTDDLENYMVDQEMG